MKDYVLGEITKNWAMDYILEKILEKLVAGQNLGKNPPEIVHSLRNFFYLHEQGRGGLFGSTRPDDSYFGFDPFREPVKIYN